MSDRVPLHTRRQFIAALGAAGVVTEIGFPRIKAAASGAATAPTSPYDSVPIRVNNPVAVGSWVLNAHRVPVGEGYKPYMALLPSGELLIVSLGWGTAPDGKYREYTPSWRSTDGGMSWSGPTIFSDVIGREQCVTCTSNGTLLMCGALNTPDANNQLGYYHSYIHRSTDGGHTWQRRRIILADEPENLGSMASRNVVEMPDGTLMLGVSQNETEMGRVARLWTSSDSGQTWTQSSRVTLGNYRAEPYDNWDGFFAEDFTYLTSQGKLLHYVRCGPPSPMFPMNDGRLIGLDEQNSADRTISCESRDGGHTWDRFADFGDYGMHYPRVLRLADGRLLMTITQRGVFYPIGLHGILSFDEGETWSFDRDRIIIDGMTTWGGQQGGGFGNTLQLADGDLLTCYSYRTTDQPEVLLGVGLKTMIEVVRWRLPAGGPSGPLPVTLFASPPVIELGKSVTATWDRIINPTVEDWVGVFPSNSAPDVAGYVAWTRTTGATSGNVSLVIPATAQPGSTYELRLFSNGSYTRLAVSRPFSVQPTTLSATPSVISPGSSLNVTWDSITNPTPGDWIGAYPSSSAADIAGYVSWIRTNGAASGSVALIIPTSAPTGTAYELRLFSNDTYNRLATSGHFSVEPTVVSANPSVVSPGSSITANWDLISNPTSEDWVGVYPSSSAPDIAGYVAWIRTTGSTSGSASLTLPDSAAIGTTYEVRLFSNGTYNRLATSSPFSVQATRLSTSPSVVSRGSSITANWDLIANPTSEDWVGVYPSSSAPDIAGYVVWIRTTGAARGSVSLIIPTSAPVGTTYEARLFSNGTYKRLATSSPFSVQ